jgi:ABC-type antimicrobial peptide transport system permease subunit
LKDAILGNSARTILLLLIGVLGILLIACANIANLFMARTVQKQRELAICASVGAKKSHLYNVLFAESGLLLTLALVLALIIAQLGFGIMQNYLSNILPRVDELSISWFTLMMALVSSLILALGFAALCNRMLNYKSLILALRSSGKGTSVQVKKSVRQFLIISQVAIASCLVFVNINLLEQASSIINASLGFEVEDRTYFSLSSVGENEVSETESVTILNSFSEQLSQLPQVESVSRSVSPLRNISTRSVTMLSSQRKLSVGLKYVDDKYFELVEQSVLQGDNFTPADIRDSNQVVLVNSALANTVAPEGDAIGMKFNFGDDEIYTIIGIVENTISPGSTEQDMQIYRHTSLYASVFLIKSAPGHTVDRALLSRTLADISSRYVVFDIEPLKQTSTQMLFSQYTMAITSGSLALLTFILASIGLYGILSYSTQLRRFELGTRLAIGAKGRSIVQLIISENVQQLLFGFLASATILISLYIAFSKELNEYISSEFVEIGIMTLLLIIVISLFACYWPLRSYINKPVIQVLKG